MQIPIQDLINILIKDENVGATTTTRIVDALLAGQETREATALESRQIRRKYEFRELIRDVIKAKLRDEDIQLAPSVKLEDIRLDPSYNVRSSAYDDTGDFERSLSISDL